MNKLLLLSTLLITPNLFCMEIHIPNISLEKIIKKNKNLEILTPKGFERHFADNAFVLLPENETRENHSKIINVSIMSHFKIDARKSLEVACEIIFKNAKHVQILDQYEDENKPWEIASATLLYKLNNKNQITYIKCFSNFSVMTSMIAYTMILDKPFDKKDLKTFQQFLDEHIQFSEPAIS